MLEVGILQTRRGCLPVCSDAASHVHSNHLRLQGCCEAARAPRIFNSFTHLSELAALGGNRVVNGNLLARDQASTWCDECGTGGGHCIVHGSHKLCGEAHHGNRIREARGPLRQRPRGGAPANLVEDRRQHSRHHRDRVSVPTCVNHIVRGEVPGRGRGHALQCRSLLAHQPSEDFALLVGQIQVVSRHDEHILVASPQARDSVHHHPLLVGFTFCAVDLEDQDRSWRQATGYDVLSGVPLKILQILLHVLCQILPGRGRPAEIEKLPHRARAERWHWGRDGEGLWQKLPVNTTQEHAATFVGQHVILRGERYNVPSEMGYPLFNHVFKDVHEGGIGPMQFSHDPGHVFQEGPEKSGRCRQRLHQIHHSSEDFSAGVHVRLVLPVARPWRAGRARDQQVAMLWQIPWSKPGDVTIVGPQVQRHIVAMEGAKGLGQLRADVVV
mmetsp:Transcript_13753/g.37222  ORF Transcript_13753/g.37222 Transcript_13753/m.37222 type:complete len:442 (-) Transcript_13753:296-1621(-)